MSFLFYFLIFYLHTDNVKILSSFFFLIIKNSFSAFFIDEIVIETYEFSRRLFVYL